MKLKYSWTKRQQAILRAMKEGLALPANLVISAKSMTAMQHIMMNILQEQGRKVNFWDTWKYFKQSDFSQDMDQTPFWFQLFCQGAAAFFSSEEEGWDNTESLMRIWWFFCQKIEFYQYRHLPGRVAAGSKLGYAVSRGDCAEILKICQAEGNALHIWYNVCHELLNNRNYEVLMNIIKDAPFPLLDNYLSVLEMHFLTPCRSNGKEKFNSYYLDHIKGCEFDLWKKHHETNNLDNILIPALQRGADPNWNVWEFGGVALSLHDYCCFMDEVAEELAGLSDFPRELQVLDQDIKCGRLYAQYLKENHKG